MDYNYHMATKRPRVRALKLAAEVRKRLTAELGQPVKVIMFGSQARGDATKYSDIDLFVIVPALDDKIRRMISEVTWEIGFEAEKVISAIPSTEEKIKDFGFLPLYRNIKKEGVPA